MKEMAFTDVALFEHHFWLQILGDHAFFIRDGLGQNQGAEIARAEKFRQKFESLLLTSRQPLSGIEVNTLTNEAHRTTVKFREFKLQLLRGHLCSKLALFLTPSFLSHMVTELEEYLGILDCLKAGQTPPLLHPMHHHLLWLHDASFHSAVLHASVDFVETDLIDKTQAFRTKFEGFYMKATELSGYLRTNLHEFPALSRLNRQVNLEIRLFRGFLCELEEMEISDEILSNFSALLPDHMAREACYYLSKLAEVTDTLPLDEDPARPRVQGINE